MDEEERRQKNLKELQEQKKEEGHEYDRLLLMWEKTFWVIGVMILIFFTKWLGFI